MTTPVIVKGSIDPSLSNETTSEETSLSHPVGGIVGDTLTMESNQFETLKVTQALPDDPISDFLCRFVDVGWYPIATTDSTMSIIQSLDVWNLWRNNTAVVSKLANYQLINGTLEVLIQTSVPAGSAGLYCISAFCNAGPVDTNRDTSPVMFVTGCLQMDHWTLVDCAASENGVHQLPWIWPYDFADLNTAPPDGMWLLNISCLQPLSSGLSTSAIVGGFKVFVRLMPGYTLAVPTFNGRSGKLEDTPAARSLSRVASQVSGVANTLGKVPLIGNVAKGVGIVANGISEIASMFGFTRETDERTPMPMTMRSVSSVARCDGTDSSDVCALSQNNAIGIDPELVGGVEEDIMSFQSLFKRWTLVEQIPWTNSTASGSELTTILVSPYCVSNNYGTHTIHPTVAGFVGAPFAYWRGDMEYMIIVPVSKFHRGSIQVYWDPGAFGAGSGGNGVTNTSLNEIIEVAPGRHDELTVGYASYLPYSISSWITPETDLVHGSFNGSITFRVINPLTGPAVTTSTQIFVFARGGSNMDFTVLNSSVVTSAASTTYSTDLIDAYALVGKGAVGDDEHQEMLNHDLVKSAGEYPGDALLWGEKVSSTRALMQKPCRVLWNSSTLPLIGTYLFPPLGVSQLAQPAGWTAYLTNGFTFVSWYRCLFVGISASERWKCITKAPCTLGMAPVAQPVTPTTPSMPVFSSGLSPTTHTGANQGAEFHVPYYNSAKFLFGRRWYNAHTLTTLETYSQRQNLFYSDVSGTTAAPEIALFHSFGPDIRVVGFRSVPAVVFTLKDPIQKTFWVY